MPASQPKATYLDADDVRVLRQSVQHCRVHIQTGGHAGEVVDHDGHGTGGRDVFEELAHGVFGHGEVEEAGDQHEGEVGSGFFGCSAVVENISRARAAGS